MNGTETTEIEIERGTGETTKLTIVATSGRVAYLNGWPARVLTLGKPARRCCRRRARQMRAMFMQLHS